MPSLENQSANNRIIASTNFSKALNHAEIPEIDYFQQQTSNFQNELKQKNEEIKITRQQYLFENEEKEKQISKPQHQLDQKDQMEEIQEFLAGLSGEVANETANSHISSRSYIDPLPKEITPIGDNDTLRIQDLAPEESFFIIYGIITDENRNKESGACKLAQKLVRENSSWVTKYLE
jgi:hypothetical protein